MLSPFSLNSGTRSALPVFVDLNRGGHQPEGSPGGGLEILQVPVGRDSRSARFYLDLDREAGRRSRAAPRRCFPPDLLRMQ